MPDDVEDAMLRARARAAADRVASESKRPPSVMEKLGRQVGLTARAALEGNPISAVGGVVGKAMGLDTAGALSRTLTRAGLPEPETATERIVQAGAQGMAGGAGMTKLSELGAAAATNPTARAALQAMSKNPGAQIGAGGGSAVASQITAEQGGGPVAQTLSGLAAMATPGLVAKTPGLTSIRNPVNEVRMQTWKAANQAGYKFPPSVIERGVGREILESTGGKAAIKQETSLHNQQVTNKLAKEGASVPPTQPLTEATLEKARDRLAQPYRELAAVSPTANKALSDWKDANANAKLHWRDYERNLTASSYKQYEKFNTRAEDALRKMDAEAIVASRLGTADPDLVARLKEARVKIAQNWDVDRALNIGTGEVRADVLGRMLNKRGEKGMTGPLGLIAKTQQAFPEYLREGAKTSTPGVSQMASLGLGSLGAWEGYHSLGLKGAVAGAATGLVAPQISRGARGLAMSKLLQRPLKDPEGVPLSGLASFLTRQQEQ